MCINGLGAPRRRAESCFVCFCRGGSILWRTVVDNYSGKVHRKFKHLQALGERVNARRSVETRSAMYGKSNVLRGSVYPRLPLCVLVCGGGMIMFLEQKFLVPSLSKASGGGKSW